MEAQSEVPSRNRYRLKIALVVKVTAAFSMWVLVLATLIELRAASVNDIVLQFLFAVHTACLGVTCMFFIQSRNVVKVRLSAERSIPKMTYMGMLVLVNIACIIIIFYQVIITLILTMTDNCPSGIWDSFEELSQSAQIIYIWLYIILVFNIVAGVTVLYYIYRVLREYSG